MSEPCDGPVHEGFHRTLGDAQYIADFLLFVSFDFLENEYSPLIFRKMSDSDSQRPPKVGPIRLRHAAVWMIVDGGLGFMIIVSLLGVLKKQASDSFLSEDVPMHVGRDGENPGLEISDCLSFSEMFDDTQPGFLEQFVGFIAVPGQVEGESVDGVFMLSVVFVETVSCVLSQIASGCRHFLIRASHNDRRMKI